MDSIPYVTSIQDHSGESKNVTMNAIGAHAMSTPSVRRMSRR
jgi:hypothetical protein